MEILFCDACDGSISRGELDEGQALRIDGRIYHRACAPRAGARRLGWLPWLLLAPAIAAGFVLGVVLFPETPTPADSTDLAPVLARIDSLEGQLQGLSAQVATVGEESGNRARTLGEAIGSRDTALVALGKDLNLLAETVAELSRSLSEPPTQPAEDVGREERLELLLDDLSPGTEFGRRFSAIRALALRPEPKALEAIRSQLAHTNPRIRSYALMMLALRHDTGSAGDMVALLDDEDGAVRENAHRALRLVSGMDFPFDASAKQDVRRKQAIVWLKWWQDRDSERDED